MSGYADFPLTVYAFHGCDETVAERVSAGETDLQPSTNKYDWLGTGVYFWENAPARAMRWAIDSQKRHPDRIHKPAVVGAIVHLGHCMNLMDKESNAVLSDAFHQLEDLITRESKHGRQLILPENKGKNHYLDALVINFSHVFAEAKRHPFDTVRAAFIEGVPVFNGSSIMSDTHIQLCVRNPKKSVVAYFRPRIALP